MVSKSPQTLVHCVYCVPVCVHSSYWVLCRTKQKIISICNYGRFKDVQVMSLNQRGSWNWRAEFKFRTSVAFTFALTIFEISKKKSVSFFKFYMDYCRLGSQIVALDGNQSKSLKGNLEKQTNGWQLQIMKKKGICGES